MRRRLPTRRNVLPVEAERLVKKRMASHTRFNEDRSYVWNCWNLQLP